MTIATTVKQYLDGHGVAYQVAHHARTETLEQAAEMLGIQLEKLARSVLLSDEKGIVMAVLPATRRLDFCKLKSVMQRDLTLLSGKKADKLFADCEPGSRPPIAGAYGMACIIDEQLSRHDAIYFEPGTHHCLVRIGRDDFNYLLPNALRGDFSLPSHASTVTLAKPQSGHSPHPIYAWARYDNVREAMVNLYRVPALPTFAQRMMTVYAEYGAAQAWSMICSEDKKLAQCIIRYSRLPLFESLPGRELDIESAYSLALGVTAGCVFRVQPKGPFGSSAFWQHALYSATLMRLLIEHFSLQDRVNPGLACLSAVTHNFGMLVLGHLFPPEYCLFNRLALAYPQTAIETIERRLLALGHAQDVVCLGHARVGARLFEDWQLPAEVVVCALAHHEMSYQAQHADYVHLLMVVDALLKSEDMGDSSCEQIPVASLQQLGLIETAVLSVFERMLEQQQVLSAVSEDFCSYIEHTSFATE